MPAESQAFPKIMPTTTIVSGILLILLGIAGYLFSIVNDNTSLTALIPAAFGTVLLLLGILAKAKENLRKHLMHAAVLIGLIGFIIPTVQLASRMSRLTVSLAVLSQAIMALICLFFVILSIQSFINARRGRE